MLIRLECLMSPAMEQWLMGRPKVARQALLGAWNDACSYDGNSTLLVPKGTFFVSPVAFEGPCYNNQPPKIQIRGKLKAPSSLYAFATSTWIMFERLRGFNLTGETAPATLDAQGVEAWAHTGCHNRPTSLRFVNISNGMISNFALLNTLTQMASTLVLQLISTSLLQELEWVTIVSPLDQASTNVTVFNITCGPGHGISVGSLGKYPKEENVMGFSVSNCTINGTENGVRIKTWPGEAASVASNLTFEDIVMINVSHPIIMDQNYCPGHKCQNSKPSHVKLINVLFKNIRGTSNTKPAVTLRCSSSVTCKNVQLVDIKLNYETDSRQPLNSQFEGDPRVPFVAYKFLSKLKFFT
ncbi:hypothetical protein F0562_034860 [Nyssa sinensis]|uniref:Pectate lyase superfamily protein domain-containing protein n=1 Tax=Nyssa sinensis TaxID=561372 RepID=A0A5J5A8P1_9ASTE|nr:hypothetical protein F0562_034860 [Nyssa sinensis]